MNALIRAELFKIYYNKVLLAVIGSCIFLYILTTFRHYLWYKEMAWERITSFSYSIGTILEGIIILLALSISFNQEYQLKMDSIIFSTKNGRQKIVASKIIAALIFTSIVVLGLWLVNIISNILMAGTSGWSLPMQELKRYHSSPFSLTIRQYCIIQMLTNLLGCIVFGIFVLMLSAYNKANLVVFFIGSMVFILPFLVRSISDFSIAWVIENLFLTEFMRVETLFNRERFINFGDNMIELNIFLFYLYIVFVGLMMLRLVFRRFNK